MEASQCFCELKTHSRSLLCLCQFLIGCGAILLPLLLLAGCSAVFLIRSIDQQEVDRQSEREEQKQMREEQKAKDTENKRAVAASAQPSRTPADGLTQRTKAAASSGKK